mmetsp:Transcript_96388/g.171334  ORF Transcript_96388/g.171334 Transcript_96388/m.171334 type:complete len:285 (+) Transcript_96388:29-883(+)
MFDFDEIEEEAEKGGWTETEEECAQKEAAEPPQVAPTAPAEKEPSVAAPLTEDESSGRTRGGGGGMFDFDEIEEQSHQPSASPKASSPSKASRNDGMFDFDEIEENSENASLPLPLSATVDIEVVFRHKSQKWRQSFQVGTGSSVLDLKRQMAADGPSEASWIQLHRFGRRLSDRETVQQACRLDFQFDPPPSYGRATFFRPKALQPGDLDDMEVIVHIDELADLKERIKVKKGSSLAELKMALGGAEDFELGIYGGSGRPIDSTAIVDERFCHLQLLPRFQTS